MKIVFFGTPPFVIPILESLVENFSVIAVVTAPDRKAGRKQRITSSAIKSYVQNELYKSGKLSNEIPIFTQESTATLISQLSAMKPDLFIVAAYGYILPNELLAIPPFGAINIHPSLLPRHRGPTPVPTAILEGDTTTGVTIIKMDEKMDHGPILGMQPYTIHTTDTSDTLLNHLFTLGSEMLPDIITHYTSGKLEPVQQDDSKATFTKKIEKSDGYIDITNPPQQTQLMRMIRAYYPWPTVWTRTNSKNKDVLVKFLPGERIQMEGKNPVTLKDFLNGYPEMKKELKEILLKLLDN